MLKITDIEDCTERFLHRVTCKPRASRARRSAHAIRTFRIHLRFADQGVQELRGGSMGAGVECCCTRSRCPATTLEQRDRTASGLCAGSLSSCRHHGGYQDLLLNETRLNENTLQISIGSVHSATNLNIESTTTVAQMGEP